jgi:RNA polymerase sigma factor (sigma-70 family)
VAAVREVRPLASDLYGRSPAARPVPLHSLPDRLMGGRHPKPKPAVRGLAERNRLVEANRRLVPWVVNKFFPHPPELIEDRIAAGYQGLIRAAELFEESKGAFSTYAVIWIKQAIQRDPVVGFKQREQAPLTVSLDGAPNEVGLVDYLEAPTPPGASVEDRDLLEGLLSELAPEERRVVALRHTSWTSPSGHQSRPEMPWHLVARDLGVTQGAAHRLYLQAMDRLREVAAEALRVA